MTAHGIIFYLRKGYDSIQGAMWDMTEKIGGR